MQEDQRKKDNNKNKNKNNKKNTTVPASASKPKQKQNNQDKNPKPDDDSDIEFLGTTPPAKTKAKRATITGVREEMRENHKETMRLLNKVCEEFRGNNQDYTRLLNRIVAVTESSERDVDSMKEKLREAHDILKNKCPHDDKKKQKPATDTPQAVNTSSGRTTGESTTTTTTTPRPNVSPDGDSKNDSDSTQKTSNTANTAAYSSSSKKPVANPYTKEHFQKALTERRMAEQERLIQAERDRVNAIYAKERMERNRQAAIRKKMAKEAAEAAKKRSLKRVVLPNPRNRSPVIIEAKPDPILGNIGGADITYGTEEDKENKKKNSGSSD